MKTKNEIMTFLQNEPLIEWRLSSSAIDWDTLICAEGKTLFFGVGLCTSKKPAKAIPFDILMFFLEAEHIKRFLQLGKVIVLIADRHALTNSFMSENLVKKLAQQSKHLFDRVTRNLNLSDFEVRMASHMLTDRQTSDLICETEQNSNQYFVHEIADVQWMAQHDNLVIKLGWSIDGKAEARGHDERFFDLAMQPMLTKPISFLFTHAGQTFDRHRQKVSPYISISGEHRLLLTTEENIESKLIMAENEWGDRHMGGTRKHLADIIRLFESLFGHLQGMSFKEKLQHVLDSAMKGRHI